MPAPTVFISYSHQDETWKTKLLPQLHALEQAGVAMQVWHDRKIDGGDKWYPEIQEAMANAVAAILLISSDFLASRFCIQEEVPALLKRQEEEGMLLIPVLLRQCPWKAHRWLKDRQMLPRDGKCVAIDFAGDHADLIFSQVAAQVCDFLLTRAGQPMASMTIPPALTRLVEARTAIPFPTTTRLRKEPRWSALPADRIDLTRLPETGSALFGRDDELALLDKAWASSEQAGATPIRVLAFTAHGGVGKSTLVNHWLSEMKRDNYRGAARVFGWSFYSQGVREQGAASADTFVAEALKFFGDEAMANSPASAWDKGVRLARLVGSERALLVLDGMEPLQSAQAFERGKLRDPALESLLRGLAKQSAGLCLITTRESLPDLARKSGFAERDLEQITPQAGRALLRTARVIGTDAELEALAQRFGPHALAISLLGVYLHEQSGHGVGPAQKLEQMPGRKPVDRVLAGFEQWLGDSAEREILHLLGLFDRPADAGCLKALRSTPAIPSLTDQVAGLGDAEWDRVLTRLEQLRLIHSRQSDSGKRFVDAHPLIREHFAEKLREKNSDAWRAAHRRLYEHLCASTHEGDQPTREDLQPLYQAIVHGCQAGLIQEAHDDVYFARVRRGHEAYSTSKLGAFGSDLGAIAYFFEIPWRRVSSSISEGIQASLISTAGFRLRALGRLTEAIEPMRVALEMRIKWEAWKHAARDASNLSELELTLGEVAEAVGDAKKSVTYADRSGEAFERVGFRTTHADALHQAGRRAEAETRFREAEQMQIESQPDYSLLYSMQGFRYCDLLLAAPERAAWQTILGRAAQMRRPTEEIESCRAVSQRAAQTLKWATEVKFGLLTMALDHLTLGRAALYAAILEWSAVVSERPAAAASTSLSTSSSSGAPSAVEAAAGGASPTPALQTAHRELDAAVAGLRRAGTQDHFPRGPLARAWLRFLIGARTGPGSAQEDLDEAWEIAERGPMKLFLADIHLYRARLFGTRNSELGVRNEETKYPWESPEADLKAAEKLINACGYHRRDEELADAMKAILGS